jgi:hypothetical protein
MCGCAKNAAGGGSAWTSTRTRWQVVLPSGAQVTYGKKEDAVRHVAAHGGTIQEISPGTKPKR